MAKLLPEATSLLLNGGSNDVSFRPENLSCTLRREGISQSLRPGKTEDCKQSRNPGSGGRNHEQHEFCRHGWTLPQ